MMKRFWCILLIGILGSVSLMSGCSSSKEESDSGALKVAFVSPLVNGEAAETYAQTLTQRDASITGVECTSITMGSSEKDPAGYMAATVQLTGFIASQEIDVIFFDIESAAADARNDTFYALSDLFTEEELTKMDGKTIDYAQVDEEGHETSERTDAVGYNVSAEEELAEFMNSDEVGIYIVGNAPHVDQAKALLLSYVSE